MNLADPLFVQAEVAYRLERAQGRRYTEGWLSRRAARRRARTVAEHRAAVTPIGAGLTRGAGVLSAPRQYGTGTGRLPAGRTRPARVEETPRAS